MDKKRFKLKCLQEYLQRFIEMHLVGNPGAFNKFRKDVMQSFGFKLYLTKQHLVYLFKELKKKLRRKG